MGYRGLFNWKTLEGLGKDLMGRQMEQTIGLQTGKINPWGLPQWAPMAQGIQANTDRGIASLYDTMASRGMSGPAVSLATEKASEGGNNALMTMANQMLGRTDQQVGQAAGWAQNARDAQQKMLIAKMQQQPEQGNSFMSMLPTIMKGIGAVGGIIGAPFTGGLSLGATAGALGSLGTGSMNPSIDDAGAMYQNQQLYDYRPYNTW
jgi:hypothetical protein